MWKSIVKNALKKLKKELTRYKKYAIIRV